MAGNVSHLLTFCWKVLKGSSAFRMRLYTIRLNTPTRRFSCVCPQLKNQPVWDKAYVRLTEQKDIDSDDAVSL
ncbi:hypothetical protein CT0861_13254 [Colletotrichum tofieldiae]|uniref:Uncharacterized protein n=1 Tax=Colletotrichum tofieldiae TaxID=708197 RepID=A0A166XNZ9_9PEZI|nr:hypothetical protein CT0861_13254 [Colletotrichum tofieldiae]